MKKIYFLKLIIPVFVLLGWNLSAIAQTTTFSTPGGPYAYTVPPCITSLNVSASGAAGGLVNSGLSGSSAKGGNVTCVLAVTPGQVLNIYVGGKGGNGNGSTTVPGGINGGGSSAPQPGNQGGSGGGGSDIRIFPFDVNSRVVVAGGGGGDGYNGADMPGGAGGGLIGASGVATGCGTVATGGTQVSGGSGGGYACLGYTVGSSGTLFQGGSSLGPSPGIGGGGGGGYYGGGGGGWGGGGGGSSYTSPTLATSVSHVQGIKAGDGTVSLTPICNAPGTIVGANNVCASSSTTLTDPAGATGGTWVSSRPFIASVGATTGVVTGLVADTVTITYSLTNVCGCNSATLVMTINPTPAAITPPTLCVAASGLATDLTAGGTWSSASPTIASIGTGGVVTGISAGSAAISYTLPSGCAVGAVATVNPLPGVFSMTGGGTICAGTPGVHVGLGGSASGVAYQLYIGGAATGTPVAGTGSAIDFGVFNTAGTYTAVAINTTTGCTKNMTGSATITVNPQPAPIGGITSACVGNTSTLTDATPGGTWTSSNTAQATVVIGTGVVTGVFAGTPTITYTSSSTGCYITTPFIVNPNPPAIVGATAVCAGATTTLSEVGAGTWSSSNPSVASIGSAGLLTGVNTGVATITYTYPTGCYKTSAITINSLPDSTNVVTGGGSYCAGGAGVHVDLSYSNAGINYLLYRNGASTGLTLPGSNSSLDFGAQTAVGVYTIKGSNSLTGCTSQMTGSVNVTTITPPAMHNVTGGGGYCSGGTGVSIGLNGSNPGVNYQLYYGATPSGVPFAGTGTSFSFGLFSAAGSYSVVATDTISGCTMPMTGTATVSVNALPIVYNVSAGGSYCAGGTGVDIALSGSDAGDSYSLMLGTVNVTSTVSTFGGPIDFGHFTTPGVYTVVANDGVSGCPNTMAGSATIVVNPAPAVYNVTGGGGYCAGGTGTHVGLSFSNTGINYQLWNGPATVGAPLGGTGLALDFGLITTAGTYTVTATNTTTGCKSNMAGSAVVNINLPPITYSLSSGGSYCIGGTGVAITTDFSQSGILYQLYRGVTPVGGAVAGTGSSISFGTFTSPGSYTAVATNPLTGCSVTLTGVAVITASALPLAFAMGGGGTYCSGDTGVHVILVGSETGVNYELFVGGLTTGIIVSGTGGMVDFGLQTTPGVYTVVATKVGSGCTRNLSGSVSVLVNPAPTAYNVIGGGVYCAGGTGVHIGLDNSSTGFSYQLFNGGTPSGAPTPGSGTAIDFGLKTATGTYTVVATNMITGCSGIMSGTATIASTPGPHPYPISSGGVYCAHGAGIDINIPSGSDPGVNYQLYRGTSAVGAPVSGSGGLVDFGYQTTPGTYTVIATDGIGCTAHMPGSALVSIISAAIYPVTGGGGFCAGGTGVNVGVGGSVTGETYQLYNGWATTGPSMAGTGAPINFGLQTAPGNYTIVGTNVLYGCQDTMAGSVNVVVNALPGIHNVTGGGAYCAGGSGEHVFINGSATGILYQLYRSGVATGTPVPGTGSVLDFGYQTAAGTYTVIATNAATSCTDTMADSAAITVKPLPHAYIVNMENYGNYCAADSGLHVTLAGSETSVKYQLYRGTSPVGSAVTGNGGVIDLGLQTVAGTYTVLGLDTGSTCSNEMLGAQVLNIIPLPTVHNVIGGGLYCSGGAGVHIGLDGSDPGIYYQLYDGPYSAGGVMGTGAPLDFGLQIALGNYVVVANSVITDCPNMMFGSARVGYDTLATPIVTLRAYPGNGVSVWHVDSIRAFVNNGGSHPAYQWLINGNPVPGATNESFTNYQFYNNDSVTCLVTASGPCGGNTTAQSLTLQLYNVGVHGVTAANTDVHLVPNPNKGAFTVSGTLGSSTDEDVTLEVVNVVGQVMYTGQVRTQAGRIDQQIALNNAANGMYLLNVRTGTQNMVIHFVIAQ